MYVYMDNFGITMGLSLSEGQMGCRILVPGTGKSHQNTSAGKFDPERAVWNC